MFRQIFIFGFLLINIFQFISGYEKWKREISYLQISSEEVKSNEFGVTAGLKNTSCPCGWANKEGFKRIIGGKAVKKHEYPFVASVIDKYTKFPFCGATIITAYHALTGAHCTWRRRVENDPIALVVGQHDTTKETITEMEVDIIKIVEHPKFHRVTLVNDIALLLLERNVDVNHFIGPACMPTSPINLDHKYVRILGWGNTVPDGEPSAILRKVDVRVVPVKTCSYHYPGRITVQSPTQFCTYGRKKGSCQGDSGGPVVWVDPETNRFTLIGIVSFGGKCASTAPTVNTDIYPYLRWISDNIKSTDYRGETCSKLT